MARETCVFWCSRCKKDHAGECGTEVRHQTGAAIDWSNFLPPAPLPWVDGDKIPEWNVGDVIASALPTDVDGDKLVFRVVGKKTQLKAYPVEILAGVGPWMKISGHGVGSRLEMGHTSLFGHHSKKIA